MESTNLKTLTQVDRQDHSRGKSVEDPPYLPSFQVPQGVDSPQHTPTEPERRFSKFRSTTRPSSWTLSTFSQHRLEHQEAEPA
eukprot:1683995-Rhodomonas_salina.1